MSRLTACAVILVALLTGFALGRFTAPRSVTDESAVAIPQDVGEATETASPRDPGLNLGTPTSRPERMHDRDSDSRGPATRVAAETGEESAPETDSAFSWLTQSPDPEELLAAIEEALEQGDTEVLERVTLALAAESEFLVPELVALLEDADSLFARENLARLLGATHSGAYRRRE